ncbi:MAG TPA: class II aldolase/adducin family protein [Anaerolineaceae bacterium]|nr:class II aldolase/adducin family protein [Anaerolineaceae bacterium]HPN51113.1 class II aldolase/adducin family protein [Anaerolineaceae bacterium]
MNKDIEQIRKEMASIMHSVAEQGLIRSSDGNMSCRIGEDRFLMTPSGVYKLWMKPEDMILIDASGTVIEGLPGLRPTSEWCMHLKAFQQRPDISCVLHAHPPYATALTLAGIPFPIDLIPEVLVALGDVPTADYGTPGTQSLADSIQDLILTHDSLLLSHHGSLCVGKSPVETLIALERLEHAARTYAIARSLGNPIPLPPSELALLREIGLNFRK